jgi:hypothetical protein
MSNGNVVDQAEEIIEVKNSGIMEVDIELGSKVNGDTESWLEVKVSTFGVRESDYLLIEMPLS